jgi:hypothetical protein
MAGKEDRNKKGTLAKYRPYGKGVNVDSGDAVTFPLD